MSACLTFNESCVKIQESIPSVTILHQAWPKVTKKKNSLDRFYKSEFNIIKYYEINVIAI